jgi:hypothetical protein
MKGVTFLDKISYNLTKKIVANRLKLKENFRSSPDFIKAYEQTLNLIHPRAVYGLSEVKDINNESVKIDDQIFNSRVLSINLESVEHVYPFIISLGNELEIAERKIERVTQQFYMDFMGDIVLQQAIIYLEKHLKKKFSHKYVSSMSPGSLKDWPISQQVPLFSLFGRIANDFGVTLTSSLLMNPKKSISGIAFPTKIPFISCQLCLRKMCPGRRAKYDINRCKEYGLQT